GGLKLFGFSREYDGYYENVTRGETEGRADYINFGGALSYDLTDSLNMLLTVERQERDGESPVLSYNAPTDLVCLLFGAPANECGNDIGDSLENLVTFSDAASTYFQDETDYTLEMNWDVSEDATITSITAFRDLKEEANQDFDATSVPFFFTNRPQEYDQISQELRLAATLTDRIDAVAGFYFLDSYYKLTQTTDSLLFADATLGPGQQLSVAVQDTR
ncbi:MAG: hypothetical protein AAGL49_15680, partial [Pseudomonadota bacterium]